MPKNPIHEYLKECEKALADIGRERARNNDEWEKRIVETGLKFGEESATRIADGMRIDNLHYDQQELYVISNVQFAMLCEINSTLMEIKNAVRKPKE